MKKNEKDTEEKVEEVIEPCEAPETAQPNDELLHELESVKESLAQKEKDYLYLVAEYDNHRRRSQKEKADAYTNAKIDAVTAFLPVYDNLERALMQETADEAYRKGVEMTMKGFRDILAKLGAEEIPALGQPFDPNFHSAMMTVEDPNVEADTVVEVFQSGWRIGERVIRFAMVKVAK